MRAEFGRREALFMTDPGSPVREVMSRGAISVGERLTLRSLAAVLVELDIGVALIARPDLSVGVVSERDLVRAIADGDSCAREKGERHASERG
jgi:CBS domain-containing protein